MPEGPSSVRLIATAVSKLWLFFHDYCTVSVLVGGGAACFAFGAKFNVPFSADVEHFLGTNSSWIMTESITVVCTRPEEFSTSGDSCKRYMERETDMDF